MLAGISILVLEDDRDTSELFAGALRKLGGEVRTAATAVAALDIVAAWRPDAILCDLHLPEVDGYGFIARLRTIAGRQIVPVIAISASHPAIERERALDAGFAEYLVKPTRVSEIIAVVTRVIADNDPRGSLASGIGTASVRET
jgi:CheY-like chemotaxis protein